MFQYMLLGILLTALTGYVNSTNVAPNWINDLRDTLQVNGLKEDTTLGTLIGKLSAVDPDGDTITYYYTGVNRIFFVNPSTGDVYLQQMLNHDVADPNVQVEFQARAGVPPQVTTSTYTFVVTDVNDNAPVFVGQPYSNATVLEGASVGTFVYGGVEARDIDGPNNNMITFSCYVDVNNTEHQDAQAQQEACDTFRIETERITSGYYRAKIYTKKELDYETKSIYFMNIMAKDSGENKVFSRTVNLFIHVQDIQDSPPFIQGNSFTVVENTDPNTLIGYIYGEDTDKGNPRSVKLKIIDDPKDFFYLSDTSLSPQGNSVYQAALKMKKSIDKEELPGQSYFIKVEAVELNADGTEDRTATFEATIEIIVEDVNDNSPKFDKLIYNISIPESLPKFSNLPMLSIQIDDLDSKKYALFEVSIASATHPGTFKVEAMNISNTGIVSLIVNNPVYLDYEVPQYRQHTVVLHAREIGTAERLSSSATVLITVKDANDNSPQFLKDVYNENLSEDRPAGTNITQVSATDLDSGVYGKVTYSFFTNSNDFSIDPSTGVITTKRKIDYESRKSISIAVKATDGGGKDDLANLNIKILNTNDQDPVFDRDNYQTTISESSTDLEPKVTVRAVDPDGNSVRYSTDQNLFQVDPVTGVVTATRKVNYVETPKLPNGEPSGYFTVTVKATDSGNPPDTGTALITIRVVDENDNAPEFIGAPYTGAVNEMDPAGTFVVQLSAKDVDAGTNGNLYFEIESGGQDAFTVDPISGNITISEGNVLNYDAQSFYRVIVTAKDGGNPQHTSSTSVDIQVSDGNNKDPQFSRAIIREYIAENINVGEKVVTVSATDPDKNSRVRYSILRNTFVAKTPGGGEFRDELLFNYKNAFLLNDVTGTITTALTMDRQRVENIQFEVQAKDENAPSGVLQTDTQIVSIIIYEVQSGGVKFTHAEWSLNNQVVTMYVQEGQALYTPLFTMLAIDSRNQQAVKFEKIAASDEGGYFTVDTNTGVVTNQKILDYEEIRELTFDVIARATYGGVESSAQTKVVVRLEDINDNPPYFDQSQLFSFQVRDGSGGGTEVGFIVANDKDAGGTSTLIYKLDGMRANHFTINSNGLLNVAAGVLIDRETYKEYNLMVSVADGPDPNTNRVTSKPVKITVTDVNDNPPEFTLNEYNIYTMETVSTGTSIGQVIATDKDKDNTQQGITYTLAALTDSSRGLFEVDFVTGEIRTRAKLRTNAKPFEFNVIARDNGDGADQVILSSSTLVKVHVGNTITDGRPYFEKPKADEFEVYVYENEAPGAFVTQIIGRDSDTMNSIRYGFLSTQIKDHEKFAIDPQTGFINTTQSLDREVQELYEVIVVLMDQDSPPKTNQRKLYVRVLDREDSKPLFGLCEYIEVPVTASVLENEPNGTYVTTVTACDKDSSPNNKILYTIVDGNDLGHFEVGILSGRLTTNASLDREVKDKYDLTVRASNPISKKRAAETIQVVITVLDLDDSNPLYAAPKGSGKTIVGGILASTPYNRKVLTVYAHDADTPKYVSTSYYIDRSVGQYFKAKTVNYRLTPRAFLINPETGAIRTNLISYAEFIDGYFTLKVAAKNSLGVITDSATVLIYVFRENYQTRFTFGKEPGEVKKDLPDFKQRLGELIQSKIIPYEVKYHYDAATGEYDTKKTDVCVDIVENNQLVLYSQIQERKILDTDRRDIQNLYKEFGILSDGVCASLEKTYTYENMYWLWYILFILAAILWLIATVLTIIVFLLWRRYKRKMKEATYVKPAEDTNEDSEYEWQEVIANMDAISTNDPVPDHPTLALPTAGDTNL